MALSKSTVIEKVARESAKRKHSQYLDGVSNPKGLDLQGTAEVLSDVYECYLPWFLDKLKAREQVHYNRLLKG